MRRKALSVYDSTRDCGRAPVVLRQSHSRHRRVVDLHAVCGPEWDFAPNLTAFASYSDIFSPQNSRDVDNKTLGPVLGKNIEAGVKGVLLNGRLNASTTASARAAASVTEIRAMRC
jgi:outer membrane receptor for ferric coprogen and ferric-rhodotorulic acid